MMVFASMLIGAAQQAGMKTPTHEQIQEGYEGVPGKRKVSKQKLTKFKKEFSHFFVFCELQLCRRMQMNGEHFRNAKVIAAIPEDKLIKMTIEDFVKAGVEISFN